VSGASHRWPNLFLVGAAKAGTTSLYDALAGHPAIFMSPVKEPHYFSRIEPSSERRAFFPHVPDEGPYLALFDGAAGEELIGEASTSYLWEPGTAGRISDRVPDARILIMLRDPVERAYSQYWNDVREGLEKREFLDALLDERRSGRGAWGVSSLYIECGLYADQVKRYLDAFGPRVHVSLFEDYTADEVGTTTEILSFLGVGPAGAESASRQMNPASLPRNRLSGALLGSGRMRTLARATVPRRARSAVRAALLRRSARPAMDPAARSLLNEVFEPEVERLGTLLGRSFPWGAARGAQSTAS
jgi:hypothetical protein